LCNVPMEVGWELGSNSRPPLPCCEGVHGANGAWMGGQCMSANVVCTCVSAHVLAIRQPEPEPSLFP